MSSSLLSLRKRNYSSRRSFSAMHDINVTPLVDVMLVLLVIFMITAPLLTVGIPVDLPKTQAAPLTESVEPLTISINAEGTIFIQETETPFELLAERLSLITSHNPEARIYVRGDQQLPYARIMEVMGAIGNAGYTKVALLAEPPRQSSMKKKAIAASKMISSSSAFQKG